MVLKWGGGWVSDTKFDINKRRGAIELKANKTIAVRRQTRTISFDRVNHSILSQFLFLFCLDICEHKMDSAQFSLLW